MTDGRDNMRLCGAVLLENDAGTLKATRIVDYFKNQHGTRPCFWVGNRSGFLVVKSEHARGISVYLEFIKAHSDLRPFAWRGPFGWAGS